MRSRLLRDVATSLALGLAIIASQRCVWAHSHDNSHQFHAPLTAEKVVGDAASSADAASEPSLEKRILRGLGPFHLVVLHFPIALLIAAAVAELWYAQHGCRNPTSTVRFCVLLGAASAVIAATLGWIHAGNGHGAEAPALLRLHRWIGTIAAAWAVGTALISEWDERRGARSQWFRACLFFGALLVAVEGHFGGMLVHGEDFLNGG
jgi:uncharacterized membrane protein